MTDDALAEIELIERSRLQRTAPAPASEPATEAEIERLIYDYATISNPPIPTTKAHAMAALIHAAIGGRDLTLTKETDNV